MLIPIFELGAIVFFLFLLFYIIKLNNYSALVVAALAAVTISMGELKNAYSTNATSYNPQFSLWFPDHSFPISILLAGISLTLLMFHLAQELQNSFSKVSLKMIISLSLLLIGFSIFMPFFEKLCVTIGLWSWNRRSDMTLGWLIGVSKYYLVHLIIALIPGLFFNRYQKKTSTNSET